MKTVSYLAEKFEKLLECLPGPVRTLVDREWHPLRDLFLRRRPARLLIVGSRPETFFRELFQIGQERIEDGPGPWRKLHHRGVLDFAVAGELIAGGKSAITATPPDIFVFVAGEENKLTDLALLGELHGFDRERYKHAAPIVASGAQTMELSDALHGDAALGTVVAAVLPLEKRQALLAAMASALPDEARLEFARVTGEIPIQREIALTLTRSLSAVSGAIGAQPIPLADFPILTSLQALLVAGIVQAAGRDWDLATARKFLTALGANVGVGLAFRETARAVVKLLPGWGNAISGAIAGAGTWAIGRAATAYFIEGVTLEETRRRFRLERKRKVLPENTDPEIRKP